MILDEKNKKLIIKEANGNVIKQYEVVVPLDEKDKKILALESEIKELKGMMLNVAKSGNANANEPNNTKKPTNGANNTPNTK